MAASLAKPVYVVDDDDATRDSLRALLEAYGFSVQDYRSCREFIGHYDGRAEGCLLLDLNLPGMNGAEFLERYADRLGRLPVVMMTGALEPSAMLRSLDAGALMYLEKPFSVDQLAGLLEFLAARGAGQAARI